MAIKSQSPPEGRYLEQIRQQPTVSGILRVLTKAGEERVWMYRNAQQFPEPLTPHSSSRFLVWSFVNLHAIMHLKPHSIAPF
jgi:hypothetical protein